ncbi:hypothetical protein VTI74DRAFT_8754 [Chaetomium olivicolor]
MRLSSSPDPSCSSVGDARQRPPSLAMGHSGVPPAAEGLALPLTPCAGTRQECLGGSDERERLKLEVVRFHLTQQSCRKFPVPHARFSESVNISPSLPKTAIVGGLQAHRHSFRSHLPPSHGKQAHLPTSIEFHNELIGGLATQLPTPICRAALRRSPPGFTPPLGSTRSLCGTTLTPMTE